MYVQSKRRGSEPKADDTTLNLGPKAAEGEYVFGVAHIFASFNDTFVVSLFFLTDDALSFVSLTIDT